MHTLIIEEANHKTCRTFENQQELGREFPQLSKVLENISEYVFAEGSLPWHNNKREVMRCWDDIQGGHHRWKRIYIEQFNTIHETFVHFKFLAAVGNNFDNYIPIYAVSSKYNDRLR